MQPPRDMYIKRHSMMVRKQYLDLLDENADLGEPGPVAKSLSGLIAAHHD